MNAAAGEGAAGEGAPPPRAEGWAVLGEDGRTYSGPRLAARSQRSPVRRDVASRLQRSLWSESRAIAAARRGLAL